MSLPSIAESPANTRSSSPPDLKPFLPSPCEILPDIAVECAGQLTLPPSRGAGIAAKKAKSNKKKTERDAYAPTSCDICGGRTNTLHYEIPSCNCCRTFFRRCIVLGQAYICSNGGRCPRFSVRSCRACRFDRCIMAGMNVTAIHLPSSTDRADVQRVIDQRRKELLRSEQCTPFSFEILSLETARQCAEIESLVYVEGRAQYLRSLIDPLAEYSESLRTNVEARVRLGDIERFEEAKKACGYKCQYEHEGRMVDIQTASNGRYWTGVDFFLCMEVAKTLPVFENLSVDNKVTLLSHNLLSNLTLMRAFYSADKQSSVMTYPDGSLPIFPFVRTGLEEEVYCRVLEPLKRVVLTVEEYVLLKAISYCNADVEGLSHRAQMILTVERERYASILLRHLQRKHGRERGAVKYAEVIALVETFYYFGQRFHDHMLKVELILRTSGRLRLQGKLLMIEDIMRR